MLYMQSVNSVFQEFSCKVENRIIFAAMYKSASLIAQVRQKSNRYALCSGRQESFGLANFEAPILCY